MLEGEKVLSDFVENVKKGEYGDIVEISPCVKRIEEERVEDDTDEYFYSLS
ncbi:MAG: hypothetical protein ABFC34_02550 [Methanobacterium sp.]